MHNYLPDDINDQAAYWATRSLSEDFSEKEKTELASWLAGNPTRQKAIDEYLSIATKASQANEDTLAQQFADELEALANERDAKEKRLQFAVPAIAASLMIAAVSFFVLLPQTSDTWIEYQTARGQIQQVTFEDGSIAHLNTATRMAVLYADDTRQVRINNGEAVFDVTPDASRPFIVETGNARTTVLGTTFNVKSVDKETVVSVLSGVVSVQRINEEDAIDAITLDAGHQVSVASNDAKLIATDFTIDQISSWVDGFIFFENTRLDKVVTDLNRYLASPIVIGDEILNSYLVTGKFRTSDADLTVDVLTSAFPIRSSKTPTGSIVLYAIE